jgi:hypothetical protein
MALLRSQALYYIDMLRDAGLPMAGVSHLPGVTASYVIHRDGEHLGQTIGSVEECERILTLARARKGG